MYVDDDGIIYDAALNQTNIGGNNNKVRRSGVLGKVTLLIDISFTAYNYLVTRAVANTMLTRDGDELVTLVR